MDRTFTAEENALLRSKITSYLQAAFPKSKDHPERYEPIIQAAIKWVEDGNCVYGGNMNFEAVDKALRPEVVREVTKKDKGDLVEEHRVEYHRDFCWWLMDYCDIRGDRARQTAQRQKEQAAKEAQEQAAKEAQRVLKKTAKTKPPAISTTPITAAVSQAPAAPSESSTVGKVIFPSTLLHRGGPFD